MLEKILVTGGAGYVGNVLIPHLLTANYRPTVYDACFFGGAPCASTVRT